MAQKSNLRSQIQALRNQAKARGHVSFENEQDIRDKAFTIAQTQKGAHAYVKHDLIWTGIFVIIALAILLLAAVEFSSFTQLNHLRVALHLPQYSF